MAPGQASPARAVFMGTPDFAAVILDHLLTQPSPIVVAAVVTQPDRPAGRGRRLTPPPVKTVALAAGIPVIQPASVRRPRFVARLRQLAPDIVVLAAYGKILPAEVLAVPPRGSLNVHASLLPRHRGAAPVASAIRHGDTTTGVSIMLMDEGMDTGPVLAAAPEPIRPDDTTETLTARLAVQGGGLLTSTIPLWLAGTLTPQAQDDGDATYCRPLRRSDGLLHWEHDADGLARQVRAVNPWPGAYTYWDRQLLKVWRAQAVPAPAGAPPGLEPGRVVPYDRGVAVICGEGVLLLDEVQLAGRRRMAGAEFGRGQRRFPGSQLTAGTR